LDTYETACGNATNFAGNIIEGCGLKWELADQCYSIKRIKMNEINSNWKSLYKLGEWVALLFILYSLTTMASLIVIGGQPKSALEGFTMLQESRLAGILRLDILTVFIMPLYYLLFFGFYIALTKSNPTTAIISLVFGFAGVTLFLATPSVFSWLALSDKFAAATDEAQKTLLFAAGETLLVSDMWHGTGAVIGGILMQTATTLLSITMLKSAAFGKSTAYVGIVTHGLDLLHLLVGLLIPAGGVILMMIAGPLYLIWFPLLARDFFRLGKTASNEV
jgi:hypothetical protein